MDTAESIRPREAAPSPPAMLDPVGGAPPAAGACGLAPVNGSALELQAERCRQQLVRYDSLLALMDELRAKEELEQVARLVAPRWKYLANVSVWRLVLAYQDEFILIEGARGKAEIAQFGELTGWDRFHWDQGHPCKLLPGALQDMPSVPEAFAGKSISEILVTPFTHQQRRTGLLSVGARDQPLTEVDQKFIRLFGAQLVDHLTLLLLRQQELTRLRSQATRDALTGALNRRGIMEKLESTLALARRTGQPVSVVMADADHFKRVNDNHGHPAGDEVLRELARRCTRLVRSGEHFGRYGGEEFIFVLYPCTGDQALLAAERIRAGVARLPFTINPATGEELPVTVSMGAACLAQFPDSTAEMLIEQADQALYAAKTAGRNTVRLAEVVSETAAA